MASKITLDYAFEDVICTVANTEVEGYDEDGGLEFEFPEDVLNDAAGAAGEVYLSKNSDERVYVDITVRQGSQGATLLGGLLQAQRAARGQIPKVPFFMKSFTTSETVSSGEAVFVQQPTPNQQSESSERVFRLLLPHAAGKILYGA